MPRIANRVLAEGAGQGRAGEGLRHVARSLDTMADLLESHSVARIAVMAAERAGGPHDRFLAELAKGVIRSRREREKFFPADLFSEPGWDMLLDLFVQRVAGKPVHVTSAIIAGAAPPTTSLRWLAVLERHGLV